MTILVRPEGISDRIWSAIKADHDEIVGRRAMWGYQELADKGGEFQRHYKEMFEMLWAKWATAQEKAEREAETIRGSC
ncbi:hypothetical protein ACUTJJ_05180 [Agrobacterium sp. DKPNP3]|uniref:hypothetical protein n=1 Tax=Agrobacterium sp. DKPNP3 TaxID=3457323 RepID=UPI004043BB17